jgi:hypothetical protein
VAGTQEPNCLACNDGSPPTRSRAYTTEVRTHPFETVIDLVHQPIEVRRDAEARRMAHNSCLHELAEKIPSMGGTEIGALLREAARNAPSNTAIVEVGCWLGAGTAQLALGIRERQNPATVQLHTYDRWQASQREVEKAAKSGWRLSIGENTLPRVSQTLHDLRSSAPSRRSRLCALIADAASSGTACSTAIQSSAASIAPSMKA